MAEGRGELLGPRARKDHSLAHALRRLFMVTSLIRCLSKTRRGRGLAFGNYYGQHDTTAGWIQGFSPAETCLCSTCTLPSPFSEDPPLLRSNPLSFGRHVATDGGRDDFELVDELRKIESTGVNPDTTECYTEISLRQKHTHLIERAEAFGHV